MNPEFSDLDKMIDGKPFNLFLGSYVSVLDKIAPAGRLFKRKIIDLMMTQIACSPIGAGIIDTLEKSERSKKRFWKSVDSEKFEEFLEKLAIASGDPQIIFNLVSGTYDFDRGVFNANHLAAANLLASGRCNAILTTNFDVGIENACRHIGFQPKIVLPGEMNSAPPEGSLVKLHGCARHGQIVADSTSLNQLAIKREYRGILREALSLPTFVMGYSGQGDVDIAVELKALASGNLIYCHRERLDKNPLGLGATAASDLEKIEPSENILIHWCPEAADHRGAPPLLKAHGPFATYSAEVLEDMLLEVSNKQGTDLHLRRLLLMYRGEKKRAKPFPSDPDFVRIPAYRIGLDVMRAHVGRKDTNFSEIMWEGFALWRLGDNLQSQNAYRKALNGFEAENSLRDQLRVCEMILGLANQDYWDKDGINVDISLLNRAEALSEGHAKHGDLQEHTEASVYVKIKKRLAELRFLQRRSSGDETLKALQSLHELAEDLKLGACALEISYTSRKIARWSGLKSPILDKSLRSDLLGQIIHSKKVFTHGLGSSQLERWLFRIFEIRATPWLDWLVCTGFRCLR